MGQAGSGRSGIEYRARQVVAGQTGSGTGMWWRVRQTVVGEADSSEGICG